MVGCNFLAIVMLFASLFFAKPTFADNNQFQFIAKGDRTNSISVWSGTDKKTRKVVFELQGGDVFAGSIFGKGHVALGYDDKGRPFYIDGADAITYAVPTPELTQDQRKLYLDGTPGTPFTLTTEPGKTWEDCQKTPSYCVAWPLAGNDSFLFYRDSRVVKYRDPILNQERYELFYQVDVGYRPKGETQDKIQKAVWIPAKYVRSTPLPQEEVRPLVPCPPLKPKSLDEQMQDLAEISASSNKDFLSQLEPHLGSCRRKKGQTGSILQKSVMSYWEGQKGKTLAYINSQALDVKTVAAIDTMARTLFGEMRSCYINGLRYPKAVAAVALKRAKFIQENGNTSPYVNDDAPELKGKDIAEILPHVLGAYKQFSAWNADDPNVDEALCPKKGANPRQLEVWRQSVEIAAQAVLADDSFLFATSEVTTLHYTSTPTNPWGYDRVYASVDGLPLDSKSCVYLWADK